MDTFLSEVMRGKVKSIALKDAHKSSQLIKILSLLIYLLLFKFQIQ